MDGTSLICRCSKTVRQLFRPAVLRWTVLGLVAFLVLVGLAYVAIPRAKPPVVLVLHRPYRTPTLLRDRLSSAIPQTRGWAWLWRFQDTIFGKRKPIYLMTDVVVITNGNAAAVFSLARTKPAFQEENGLQCWIAGAPELAVLEEGLKHYPGAGVLAQPRFSTGDGVGSSMAQQQSVSRFESNTTDQLTFEVFPRVQTDCSDLFLDIRSCTTVKNGPTTAAQPISSSRTNFALAVRIQIPKGSGACLLFPSCDASNLVAITVKPK